MSATTIVLVSIAALSFGVLFKLTLNLLVEMWWTHMKVLVLKPTKISYDFNHILWTVAILATIFVCCIILLTI